MPALYASSITPFIAVGEAGIEKMMSTPSWIIWRICWIWTSFAPFESVTTRSPSTRPCSFAAAKFSLQRRECRSAPGVAGEGVAVADLPRRAVLRLEVLVRVEQRRAVVVVGGLQVLRQRQRVEDAVRILLRRRERRACRSRPGSATASPLGAADDSLRGGGLLRGRRLRRGVVLLRRRAVAPRRRRLLGGGARSRAPPRRSVAALLSAAVLVVVAACGEYHGEHCADDEKAELEEPPHGPSLLGAASLPGAAPCAPIAAAGLPLPRPVIRAARV